MFQNGSPGSANKNQVQLNSNGNTGGFGQPAPFLQYTDENSKVAMLKAITYRIDRTPSYRHNVSRYMNVIRSIVVGESDVASHERKELLLAKLWSPPLLPKQLCNWKLSVQNRFPPKTGLASNDPEVRSTR